MTIDPQRASPQDTYRLLTSCVVPRPIALVSTVSIDGIRNVAPFSFFNAVSAEPPIICFCPSPRQPPKDTLVNVRETREFVVNIVSEAMAEAMNASSAPFPPDVDEFEMAGFTPVPSEAVTPPRVGESPVSLECRLHLIVEVSDRPFGGTLVLGEVVRFHVQDCVLRNGRIDADLLGAIARMGGIDYSRTRDRFSMRRPGA